MENKERNYDDIYDDFEEKFSSVYEKEKEKFEEIINQKLIISLLGDVNVGKSQTMNSLTGKRISEVGAVAGLTTGVSLHPFNDDKSVWIADTPGLKDIKEEISEKALDFIENNADIVLLFFNAAVGAEKHIIDTFHAIKGMNKPILLVLNKIDIWYKNDKLVKKNDYDTTIAQIEHETGQNVIPISAEENINIEQLNNEIISFLEKSGKDILFLKVTKYKEEKVSLWINGATAAAFGIGLIPLPGADIVPLTSLQVSLALKIAYIYNCKVTKNDVMTLIGSTITGGFGKQFFRWGVQAMKGLGWLGTPIAEGIVATFSGIVAASVTYGFGWAANAYYKSGMQMDLGDVGAFYSQKYREYYDKKKNEEGMDNENNCAI